MPDLSKEYRQYTAINTINQCYCNYSCSISFTTILQVILQSILQIIPKKTVQNVSL